MFLSKAAITKQLFLEFLNFKTLGLAPGKPAELKPGTLLGSSSKADIGLGIEFAERQLRAHLKYEGMTQQEQEQFHQLLSSLITYKKASFGEDNPFIPYTKTAASTATPCAWLVFAPLLISSDDTNLAYKTQAEFIKYLANPKIGFQFDKSSSIENTGLYLAVQTNNHQMVDAFLCPEFYGYHLTKEDLKKLLSLTNDTKTRLTLFLHSKELINWLSEDKHLQISCITSFAELAELWPHLSAEQRKKFIQYTNAQLWLMLLDDELGKRKIEKLLGPDFSLLNKKLIQDLSIKNQASIHKTLQYLSRKQQFHYLLNALQVNKLFPSSRGDAWNTLLSALGYQINEAGRLTVTRYVLPEPIARIHNQLIYVLISLPIETELIIKALEKIETYVHQPKTKEDYQHFLNGIANDVVKKEYETGFFLINWFNKLLRYLNVKSKSPLHPYIDKLVQVINDEPVAIIPGDIMSILPPTKDYTIYKEALAAYFEANIDLFWLSLSPKVREKIVQDPIRFEALIRFLAKPTDHRSNFFKALDKESLNYFNTPKGLQQLVLNTPSFNIPRDLPVLINTMKASGIQFLEDVPSIVELLLESSEEFFAQICSFFPLRLNNNENLLFQQSILEALPKPLKEEHFSRFLRAYCTDAHHFSDLLLMIHNSNPLLVNQCWECVSEQMWVQWYGSLEHALHWSQVLKHLELSDRLDFFEKLTSGGKLTAEEFCDFLLEKNEAVFITLWNKIPESQWSTWLKDNANLPATTLSLLNTMAYPLKVQFFKAMLKMTSVELANLCVAPNKTIEQFYPQEVLTKVAAATTVNDTKAKLNKLKENKQHEFDENIEELIKAIQELNKYLKEIGTIDIKAHNNWGYYTASFFKTDPYYTLVRSISVSNTNIARFCEHILAHPLLAVVKEQISRKGNVFIKLAPIVLELSEYLDSLRSSVTEMPAHLHKEFNKLDQLFTKIKEIHQPLSMERVGPGENIRSDSGVMTPT